MLFKKNERYNAYKKLTRICEESKKRIDFNLFFSLKVLDINDNKILFDKINPLQYLSIIGKFSDFFIVIKDDKRKYIFLLKIEKIEDSKIWTKIISKEELEERRVFERFPLCKEDFGYFDMYIDGSLICKNVYIEDISVIGIKIYVPKKLENNTFKNIMIKRDQKRLEINIEIEKVDALVNSDHTIIRGKIVDSNKSIAKIIINRYIEIAKKLLENKE
ncbi:hypothetical protein [Nitrosophilus kaiyonis]|uniref:hypothetical protein n=1 Tax=Nitrosophilus kaiyonis TaxID=2930200 RepID=UPI0024926FFA|nr:hypothetical protein [Nitrosophilus kaiyonis]